MRTTLPVAFALLLALASCTSTRRAVADASRSSIADPARHAAVFERFKRLEGTWQGRSTKGWTERITFQTIAAGSCVVETSFDAHPNEKMLTIFHMDGAQLMLTHYCVARSQPRLRASEFSDDGSRVTFTFADATNLPSRDQGHMDKVVFRFIDDDHFTAQWTWYEAGKESWMEEIVNTRVDGAGARSSASR